MTRTELRCLYEGTVSAEEIDHLGHMNVRFYATRAMAATRALLAENGLDEATLAADDTVVGVPDTFTRHYREQLEGARLAVMSGVIGIGEAGLLLHHELVNADTGELAATFRHRVEPLHRASREPRPFSSAFVSACQNQVVEWPEHGRPRTIDLEALPAELGFDEARRRGLAMRLPRRIASEECGADGYLHFSRTNELVWGGERTDRAGGFPLLDLEDGSRFGWATMESRHVVLETPREGCQIQSFGAEVQVGRKTSFRHNWVFDVDRARLVCIASSVNLAFDIAARRSIEIPDGIRAGLEADCHPDLI
jgi:acyl-CoA thioester hydrolase